MKKCSNSKIKLQMSNTAFDSTREWKEFINIDNVFISWSLIETHLIHNKRSTTHGTPCALLIVQLGSLMRFDRKRRTSRISQSGKVLFADSSNCDTAWSWRWPALTIQPPSILSFSINQLLARLQNSSHCGTAVPFISLWGKEQFYHKNFWGTQKLTWCQQFGVQHPSKWEYPKGGFQKLLCGFFPLRGGRYPPIPPSFFRKMIFCLGVDEWGSPHSAKEKIR